MTVASWHGEKELFISNSQIQLFKEDRRGWWLAYYRELGMKRSTQPLSGARDLGTRVHHALHALYEKNANPITVIDELYEKDRITLLDHPSGEDKIADMKKEQDLAHAMLEGFLVWREEEGIDVGMKLVAAESIISIPFAPVPGVILRGKLDQRWMRKSDGARLFRDWKTVGDLKSPMRLLPLDEQMKFYHMLEFLEALQKNGEEPKWRTDGALYTMLRKVKRTAAAKPPFYGQLEVHNNIEELRSMYLRVQKIVEEIVVTRQALDAGGDHRYWCPPRPCRDLTWKSDFFPVYGMFDDGSNAEGFLAEYYEHVDPDARYETQSDVMQS